MAALQLQVEGRPRTEGAAARASERTAAVAGGREWQEQGEEAAKERQEQGDGEEGLAAAAAAGGEGGVAVFHEDSVEARLDDLEEQVRHWGQGGAG